MQLDFFAPAAEQTPVDKAAPELAPASLGGHAPETAQGVAPPPPSSPPRPPSASPHAHRSLQLRDHVLAYRLLRSKRRSIGFLIDDDGLRITAPKWVPVGEVENAIREKERWIVAKLNERRERMGRRLHARMQWRDGATLPYLGGDVTLRMCAEQASGVIFDAAAQELRIGLPPAASEQQMKDRVQAWLQLEARRVFGERLPLYAEKLGVAYRSFALSSALTQWGSCTVDGKIRLSWRLIHFGVPIIDYVVAHELAHLREMNHSPRFWAAVQSVFPGFEQARKVLRERGPETLPIF